MTPAQCRAARALAGLTQDDLGQRVGVDRRTVRLFEKGHTIRLHNASSLRTELERAGIEFIDGRRPGVRVAAKGLG